MPSKTEARTKVFYVSDMRGGEVVFGELDNKEPNKAVKVNGEFVNTAYIFLDTMNNRELLTTYRRKYREWRAQEPNLSSFLERMDQFEETTGDDECHTELKSTMKKGSLKVQ